MRVFSLQDEKFEEMKMSLNASIVHVAKKIAAGEFEQGDITLKLKIGTVYEHKEETVYKMPAFNYKIGTNLQKKSSLDGGDAYQGMEFKLDDGVVVLTKVQSNQIDMLDEEDDKEEWKIVIVIIATKNLILLVLQGIELCTEIGKRIVR